jgi:hypothetical protein
MSRTPIAALVPSLLTTLLLFGTPAPVAAQTAVTTCGQETRGPAVLNADLDCTGFDGYALTMHGGTLTMNGHTITGGNIGVECDVSCKIVGPGSVTASVFIGVNAYGVGLKMSQVDVSNCGYFGAQVWDTAVIEGPATFTGNGVGITVGVTAKLKDLTITGNGTGVDAANNFKNGTISVQGSTITGNDQNGLLAQHGVKVKDSTITGNGQSGIYSTGGFHCEKIAGASIKASTVTGNGANCPAGQVCADVATCKRKPRVKSGSTCGTSYQIGSGNPGQDWGVCTLD